MSNGFEDYEVEGGWEVFASLVERIECGSSGVLICLRRGLTKDCVTESPGGLSGMIRG